MYSIPLTRTEGSTVYLVISGIMHVQSCPVFSMSFLFVEAQIYNLKNKLNCFKKASLNLVLEVTPCRGKTFFAFVSSIYLVSLFAVLPPRLPYLFLLSGRRARVVRFIKWMLFCFVLFFLKRPARIRFVKCMLFVFLFELSHFLQQILFGFSCRFS